MSALRPGFQLDLLRYELRGGDRVIRLERQPMELLILLAERAGRLVTREEIAETFWGGSVMVDADHGINNMVRKLRLALGDDPEQPQYLETVVGKGYRFIGDLEVVGAPSAKPEGPPQSATSVAVASHPSRGIQSARLWFALLIILATTASWAWWRWQHETLSAQAAIRSIAVLPLENLSGDPSQDYFADALTDELITSLAKIRRLRVTSRTSVLQYRGSKKSLRNIKRELNVDAVLEGAVQRSGDRVRVTAQLIRAADDTHLWADNYDRDLRDVLALESDVARAIAKQVQAELTPEEQMRFSTPAQVDLEAYQLYLRGLHAWNQGPGEGASNSQKYFQQAIDRDPRFAPAYAWLAFAHNLNSEYQLAQGPARKALELDDSLAIAHSALAFATYRGDWDFSTAGREFQRALELGPNDPMTLATYALYLWSLGRMDESIEETRRVLEVDPLSPLHNANLAMSYVVAGREKEGILQAKTALDIAPTFSYSHVVLGLAYERVGQYEEAAAQYRKVGNAFGDAFLPVFTAHLYASEGRRAEALQLVHQLGSARSILLNKSYVLAEIYAKLGDKEEAFRLLEKAYQEHAEDLLYLKTDQDFKPLRSDRRFQDFLLRIGIPQQQQIAH